MLHVDGTPTKKAYELCTEPQGLKKSLANGQLPKQIVDIENGVMCVLTSPDMVSGMMDANEGLAVWQTNTSSEKWRNTITKETSVAANRLPRMEERDIIASQACGLI